MKLFLHKWVPRFFYKKFDGGKDSGVTGYFLIEWKKVFSIGLLHFKEGSREAYHSHAFFGITWWLKGSVIEQHLSGKERAFHPSFRPKFTSRDCFHRVVANTSTWALTFRGPWEDKWFEYRPKENKTIVLTHGRKVV